MNKSLQEMKAELDQYEIIGENYIAVAKYLIRGEVRQMFFSELLKKKYLSAPFGIRFFISKTQAMPMIQQLKLKGFMVEKEDWFLLNIEWVKDFENCSLFKKKEPEKN